jgi:hypothetical protein
VSVPGYNSSDLAKPPSPRDLRTMDREWTALKTWYETGELGAVRKRLNLRSNAEAQVYVNRAVERYEERRRDGLAELRAMQDMDLERALRMLRTEIDAGNIQAVDRLVRVLERRSKLYAADLEKETSEGGGLSIVVQFPWEAGAAGEVVDSQAVEIEPSRQISPEAGDS